MRTIVHVGLHKTGTTTLQDFLAKHREMLAAQGVHYPVDPRGEWSGAHRLACHLSSPRALDGPNDLFTPEREIFSQMTGARNTSSEDFLDALSTDLPLCVLSSEIFETFDRAELARLRSFVGPIDHFVLYVRDGIGYIHSCWSAKVRWGYTGSFAEFLRATVDFEPATPIAGPLRFARLLTDNFGRDKVAVRSLATASKHPRGLIGDFLEQELKLQAIEVPASVRSNVSPPHIVTEVTRALNLRAGSPRSDSGRESHNALRLALAGPDGAKFLDEFSRRLAPFIKKVSIDGLAPTRICADGSIGDIGDIGASLASLFSEWKFEVDESKQSCKTQDLLAALDQCETFTRLAEVRKEETFSKSVR